MGYILGEVYSGGLICTGKGINGILRYISDLSDGLSATCKTLADNTSFIFCAWQVFFTGWIKYWSQKISDRDIQWKIKFNPDQNKEVQEICFSNWTTNDNSFYNI